VDAQGNVGSAEVAFRKINPRTLSAQSTKFPTLRLLGKGRVRTITGSLRSTLPFAIPGKVTVQWQARRSGRWKKIHASGANANRPFRFKQKLRYGGKWRVRVVFKGAKPFKRSASKWKTFRVR
jgi:hypothetical protein